MMRHQQGVSVEHFWRIPPSTTEITPPVHIISRLGEDTEGELDRDECFVSPRPIYPFNLSTVEFKIGFRLVTRGHYVGCF